MNGQVRCTVISGIQSMQYHLGVSLFMVTLKMRHVFVRRFTFCSPRHNNLPSNSLATFLHLLCQKCGQLCLRLCMRAQFLQQYFANMCGISYSIINGVFGSLSSGPCSRFQLRWDIISVKDYANFLGVIILAEETIVKVFCQVFAGIDPVRLA